MNDHTKKVEALTLDDLKTYPIWQYTNDEKKYGETVVRPVKRTPVEHLAGRIVGTQVWLANGAQVWALIGNVTASSAHLTQHFLRLSVLREGRWFTMARYHDVEANVRGPQALATFLNLQINEIFPISYNICCFCRGEVGALVGMIQKEPQEKLTRAQIIALAVP